MTRSSDPARGALSRRRFLTLSAGGLVAVQALAVACQSAAPAAPAAATSAPAAANPPAASGAATTAPAAKPTTAGTAPAAGATSAPANAAPATTPGGPTLVVVSNSEPNPLEPSLNPGLDTSRYVNDVYDRLIDYDLTVDADTPPVKPSLATDWTVSDDGLTYTFKLRPNVTFHDGTPFDAAAAKFNIDRVTQPSFEYYFERGAGASKSVWGRVSSTSAPDPTTLVVQLSQPYASFTDALALTYGSMASPSAIKANGNDNYPSHAAGTGPFKFVQQDQGVKMVLARNDSYWGGAPPLGQVVVRPISEITAAVSALVAGEVQLVSGVTPDLLDSLKSHNDLSIKLANIPQTYAWNLNVTEPPFNDKRVRQAINYAIDRDTYANAIMKGLARPSTSVFGPGMAGYDPSFQMYSYDPDKAKALLQEAGVGSGLSFKVQTAKAQGMDDVALFVKDNLSKIGVNVDVELFDFPTILANANKSGTTPGVAAIGWSWIADPAFNFDRFFTSSFGPPNGVNFGFYNNPEVDAAIADAGKTADRVQRLRKYQDLNRMVTEDAAWLFLYHPIEARVATSKLDWTSANSTIFTLRNAALK
jgi:peptide/nickel transport system substrate-binding protein